MLQVKTRQVVVFFATLVILLLVGVFRVHGQSPLNCEEPGANAAFEVIAIDQFENPAPRTEFSLLQSDGNVQYGSTLNGSSTGCAPAGRTTFEAAGQFHTLDLKENVRITVPAFEVDVPLPGNEWLTTHYVGPVGAGDSSYKFLLDEQLLSADGWECEITPTINDSHVGSCETHYDLAEYVNLEPGTYKVTVKATHRETQTAIILEKLINVPWREQTFVSALRK